MNIHELKFFSYFRSNVYFDTLSNHIIIFWNYLIYSFVRF